MGQVFSTAISEIGNYLQELFNFGVSDETSGFFSMIWETLRVLIQAIIEADL